VKKLLVLCVFLALGAACAARTITVDDDGPADFNTIQAAIDDSANGDTVVIYSGIYTGDGNRDIDYGGRAITVRSTDPNDPDVVAGTIIDCNGSEDEPHRGFYFRNYGNSDSVIAGLTIRNGYATRDGGGAISCRQSSPSIINCTIIRNSCDSSNPRYFGGGGFCSVDGSPTLTGCVFIYNTSLYGGGVYDGGTARLVNCTFIANSAENGGALYNREDANLTDCIFIDNSAYSGGAIYNEGDANLTNCVFVANSAIEYGGALRSDNSATTLLNCTFIDNEAQYGSALSGGYEITNCILRNDANDVAIIDIEGAVTYSNIQGGWEGVGNIDVDPNFAFDGEYHLMGGSACIDAGTNEPNGVLPAADIDGEERPLDGDNDANATADMGAHEYNQQGPGIAVSGRYLSFCGTPGAARTESQTLQLRNCGGGTLNWSIHGPGWLRAEPASGTSAGEIVEIDIWAKLGGLAVGNYEGVIRITDPNAANSGQEIYISLRFTRELHVPQEYPTIREAITEALDYDTVIVSPGTHTEGEYWFPISFHGKAITVRSTAPSDPCVVAATIVDCQGSECGFSFSNGEGPDSVLDGLTIINGYSSGVGAIFCYQASPTIRNCVIKDCWAGRGAAIYCEDAAPTIINCTFNGNLADYHGIIYGSEGPIVNCTITGNIALGFGLIDDDPPFPWPPPSPWPPIPPWPDWIWPLPYDDYAAYETIEPETVQSSQTITDTQQSDLTAINSGLLAADIWDIWDPWEPPSPRYGGVLSNCSGSIINCVIKGNMGHGLEYCDGSVINCYIGTNEAAGLYVCDANIINCTIAYNRDGGIMGCDPNEITLTNTIIWGNAGGSLQNYCEPNDVNYCCIQGWDGSLGGTGNFDADPMLTPDGHLRIDSPCINAGDPNADYSDQTDIDGERRVAYGRADIGCDEYIDVDGDGLPNWWEQKYTNSHNQARPYTDPDSDGYRNLAEYQFYSSDPTDPAKTYHVDANQADDSNDGSLWETAKRTIQAGINAASNSDTVVVAPGIYSGDDNNDIDFGGRIITLRSEEPDNADIVEATIIDCNGGRGFYFRTGESALAMVRGFTIMNGYADYGGAIRCYWASPTIKSCNIIDNTAEYGGGAIDCTHSEAVIIDCNVTDNSADSGGGISCFDGKAEIVNSNVSYNLALVDGGAIFCEDGNAVIRDCRLVGNNAQEDGGAICSVSGSPIISGCDIRQNIAQEYGGGIACDRQYDDSMLTSSIITGNRAGIRGGAICEWSGSIVNCTVAGNHAPTDGSIYRCLGLVSNCIVWENRPENATSRGSSYCCVQGGSPGLGSIDCDPCFVEAGYWDSNGTAGDDGDDFWVDGDYHLKSEGWRWDVGRGMWIWDDVTSRCIDAGNPGSGLGSEPLAVAADPGNQWGQNLRINIGAYGGTSEASMGPYEWALLCDTGNDGITDFDDLSYFTDYWLTSASERACDFDRNGIVDGIDFARLGQEWLKQTTWRQ